MDALHKLKKQKMEPLPVIDHAAQQYDKVEKDFYEEHEEITKLPDEVISQLRFATWDLPSITLVYSKDMEIRISGRATIRPIISFGHLKFDDVMLNKIVKQEFEKPTPIQCQVRHQPSRPISLGSALSFIWSRCHRHSQDRIWQDLGICMAHDHSYIGSGT
jgi:hypothetical protein